VADVVGCDPRGEPGDGDRPKIATGWSNSPAERRVRDYVCPNGIPRSIFLGRVPRQGEPHWLPSDITAALEWQSEQDRKCPGCGQNIDETFGPGNVDKWNAEVSGHCDGCRAMHRAASIAAGKDDLDPTVGSRYRVWRDIASANGSG